MAIKQKSTHESSRANEDTLDFDVNDSVAINRLVDEMRDEDTSTKRYSTAYNRTYNRHNR